MSHQKDLYEDLQRIEDRSKKKKQRRLSGMFTSLFSKEKEDEQEGEDEEE